MTNSLACEGIRRCSSAAPRPGCAENGAAGRPEGDSGYGTSPELKKVLPSATDTVVLVGFTTAIPFAKDRRHAAPDRMRARYPRFSVTEVRADPLGGVNGAACGEQ